MYKQTSKRWDENIYNNFQSIIKVYCDDVLIDSKYITDFKIGSILFEEELSLGSTPSQYIEIQIHKQANIKIPKIIRVEYGVLLNYALRVEEVNSLPVQELDKIPVRRLSRDDSDYEMIPIGIYNVDDYNDEDDNVINIKALDNMINLEQNNGYYDASELINKNGYATLGEIAQDICNQKGLELGTDSFLNSDKRISVYDNNISAREYMGMIAESAGGFCCAGRDGKIYFKSIGEDEAEIPLKLFKTYKFGEEYKITKVAYEDGIRSFKFGDEIRNTLWISQDNMFIVDEQQIEKIYDKIKDLTINSFEGTVIINPVIDIGDKIKIAGKTIIYQGEMTLNGRFLADIKNKISIKQRTETTVKKESQKSINRKIQSQIDAENLKITQLIENQTETSDRLTKHEQTIDTIQDTVSQVNKKVDGNTETLQSQIKQTADEINAEVSKKVGEDEVISKINMSTEGIVIQGDKVDIEGKSVNYKTEVEDVYTLTQEDAIKIAQANTGSITLTDTEKELYDLNNDGEIDLYDTMIATQAVQEGGKVDIKGTFEINSKDARRTIILRDSGGNISTSIGLLGMQTQSLGTDKFTANSATIQDLTTSNAYTNSDENLKENIKELDEKYFSLLEKIKPVRFRYKRNKEEHIGFIAQNVKKAFDSNEIDYIPIKQDEMGIYSLDYTQLIPVLWKIVQEQGKKIKQLEGGVKNE